MQPIAEVIEDHLYAVPFVPFTMHMADQRAIVVPHPDFATLTPGRGPRVVATEGDRIQIQHLRLATQVELSEALQAD